MAYSNKGKFRRTSPKKSRSNKRRFPTSPITPRSNKYGANKLVRPVKGTSNRFEVIDEEYTPFARACKIELAKENPEQFEYRDDFDYSLGSISIRPSDKNRIASDEGDEDGNNQVATEKVVRNPAGIIISTEDSEENGERMVIANARYVFDNADFRRIVDTEITELAVQPQPLDGPNKAPIVIDTQCYPGYGLLDGSRSDGYTIQTLPELGEPSYQIPSNNNVAFYADAYSYIDDDGTRKNEGLTYIWRFTADGIGNAQAAIVGNEPVLRLYNVQLQQRGRYTCEVQNEKGSSYTKTIFLNPLGGLLRELDDNGLPTGALVRDDDHDAEFSQFDSYFDYDTEDGRWFLVDWNGNQWVESNQEPNFYKGKDLPKSTNQAKTIISKASAIATRSQNLSRSRAIGKYFQDSTSNIFFIEPGKPNVKFTSMSEYESHKETTGFTFQGTNEVDKLTYKDQEL
jgi:hypothetical protein|tara:strand:- start:22600 stop:23970 length:1371 start_codon:yes stop_codon:yes gene_type:complete